VPGIEKIIELSSSLLISLIGFVTPMVALLMSIFGEGLRKLAEQYESERAQTEKKLANQLQKSGEAASLDVSEIERTIKELREVKSTAERKLQLLDPKKAVIGLFVPLFAALLFLLPSIFYKSTVANWWGVLSILCAGFAIQRFWQLLDIVVEVKKTVDAEAREERRKVSELLSEIAKNTLKGSGYYLEKVFISFNNVKFDKDMNEYLMYADRKLNVPVKIVNDEARMAKDVEAGLRFPPDFLIEKNPGYTVYMGENEQIVRYSVERIHGSTSVVLAPLVVTPLKKGQFEFKTFMKGENIEAKYRDLRIKVE